jgi:hypothetical protein
VTANGKGVIAFTLMGEGHFPSAAYATLDAIASAGDIHIAAEGLGPDDGSTAYKGFIGQPHRCALGRPYTSEVNSVNRLRTVAAI